MSRAARVRASGKLKSQRFRMTDLGIKVLRERHGVVPGRHASFGVERGYNFVLTVWILR
jgi:hypothetical protein